MVRMGDTLGEIGGHVEIGIEVVEIERSQLMKLQPHNSGTAVYVLKHDGSMTL